MMANNNIYDTANQLERDLRELDAFKQLQASMKTIKDNEKSNTLFERFKTQSQAFQMMQMTGQEPDEAQIKEYQALSQEVMEDEAISQLMNAERQLSQVMEDINRIITLPLQEIYQA